MFVLIGTAADTPRAIDDRQFFVSHTHNSLQTITALLPIDEGTLLLYAIRTSTDSVDGLTTSIAHRLGRGRLREAVVEHLETLRR